MIRFNLDCLSLIFNELESDKKSLYSCILVNRQWCQLIVPILWRKYPLYYEKSGKKLFNTILSGLPTSSKQLLFDNNIKLPLTILSKPLLFNYVSFCKYLETGTINGFIEMMFEEEFSNGEIYKRILLGQEIYKLFVSQCKNIKELSWQTTQPLSLFPGASTCFSQLYSLSIDMKFITSDALYEMAQICKDLSVLIICNCSQGNPGLISLIDAQRNLKSVSLYDPHIKKETYNELNLALARKGKMINNLNLGSIGIIPPSFLISLINLKMMTIYNYYKYEDVGDEIKEFQQYLTISEFSDLHSLNIYGLSCFKEFAMLIEKTKGNISRVIIYTFNKVAENTGMLIKAIANNCPKIEQLSTYLEPKDFIHVKSLLLNCKNLITIELDSLNCFMNENDNVGDELLDILTKFSPKSLTNIIVGGDWKYSVDAFERFFESYRERNLLNFGITSEDNITEEHKAIIRKYINEEVINESRFVVKFYL
jgi:hypothetical protein